MIDYNEPKGNCMTSWTTFTGTYSYKYKKWLSNCWSHGPWLIRAYKGTTSQVILSRGREQHALCKQSSTIELLRSKEMKTYCTSNPDSKYLHNTHIYHHKPLPLKYLGTTTIANAKSNANVPTIIQSLAHLLLMDKIVG